MSPGPHSLVVWLSGKPAAGKSTLAAAATSRLRHAGFETLWLDGERVRSLIAPELGFTAKERHEFEARLAEVVRSSANRHDIVLISAAASEPERAFIRALVPRFLHVVVTAPSELCARRDPKGLYAKVRLGKVAGVPGIDAPYDEPTAADMTLSTESKTVDELASELVAFIRRALATSDAGRGDDRSSTGSS